MARLFCDCIVYRTCVVLYCVVLYVTFSELVLDCGRIVLHLIENSLVPFCECTLLYLIGEVVYDL